MTAPLQTAFVAAAPDEIARISGGSWFLPTGAGTLDPLARRVDRLTRGAVARLLASPAFAQGEGGKRACPRLSGRARGRGGAGGQAPAAAHAGRGAAAPAPRLPGSTPAAPLTVLAGGQARVGEVAQGLALRAYAFDTYRTPEKDAPEPNRAVSFAGARPRGGGGRLRAAGRPGRGGHASRATSSASRPTCSAPSSSPQPPRWGSRSSGSRSRCWTSRSSSALGMRTLLAVGQGSESPSKVVVMQWKGGGDEAPLALVGKGVVFDTGGISIKPGAGMEEMTMDMGGAAVVAGVMRTLALRKAPANVVGPGRAGREHARRQGAAAGRRGALDEGRHDRGDQHRRRGAARAGGRALVRAGALQAARRWSISPR